MLTAPESDLRGRFLLLTRRGRTIAPERDPEGVFGQGLGLCRKRSGALQPAP